MEDKEKSIHHKASCLELPTNDFHAVNVQMDASGSFHVYNTQTAKRKDQ